MALARGRRSESGFNYWPGFVDALSTLVLAIVFLLSVFLVVQFYLSQEVSGKDKALEQLTSHKPRVAFLLTAPFDENLKEFESVANDLAHVASFALVEDHRGTGLYPGKVGCVAPNASVHRFPGGDLRVSSSVFARPRGRAAMAWRCLALGVAPRTAQTSSR